MITKTEILKTAMLNQDWEQAIRIALTLPNPKIRSPKRLKPYLVRRISRLKNDINILKKDDRSSCFL